MTFDLFTQGLAIGFSIAAPVGPIGVLCIRRSLADGPLIGFATGMGAATADAAYGCIAGFGLTAVARFLTSQQFWLGMIGGAFLCLLGVRTFLSKPADKPASATGAGPVTAYLSAFALTITNPATILSFAAVFAGLGIAANSDYTAAAGLVSGVFLGSAAWWLLLSAGVGFLHGSGRTTWMKQINRLSGVILVAFGCYAIVRQLR